MSATINFQQRIGRADNAAELARAGRREQWGLVALVLPAAAFVVALMVIPLVWLFWQSITDQSGALTLMNYVRIFTEEGTLATFQRTFAASLMVTAICVVLGYPVAFLAAVSKPRTATIIMVLVLIPFWTSVLVRTYAWLVLLQRTGLVNQFLTWAGVVEAPLTLVHNLTGSVIGMVHIMLPFVVLTLYSSLTQIPADFGRAAASLGARPGRVFRTVIFPLSLPGLAAGSVFVFVLSLGFYITPELLGGGRTVMVSMLVQRNIDLYFQFGSASAVAFVLLAATLLILWLADRVVPLGKILADR
ncbi:ABC transporter permease [Variovorax paradoxus]|nr:ABC transporter permease [Variovorax paradoxus]